MLPNLQRHAFVKWWVQFDTSKAGAAEVKKWFEENPQFLEAADPETSLFLNQKSKLASFFGWINLKGAFSQKLKRGPTITPKRRSRKL